MRYGQTINAAVFITGKEQQGDNNQCNAIAYGAGTGGPIHMQMAGAATYYRQTTGGNFGLEGYFGIAVSDISTGGDDPYGITDGELESQTRLAINNAGNVGIGTTDPGYELEVNGDIKATAFRIDQLDELS